MELLRKSSLSRHDIPRSSIHHHIARILQCHPASVDPVSYTLRVPVDRPQYISHQ